FAAARQALTALGAEPDSSARGVFVLRAPFEGEVGEVHATVGEVVGPEASPFLVGELNRVWLLLDLYETDLHRVSVGAPARVVADAYPDRPFQARVGHVGVTVDSVSRSIKVRLEIPNPDHLLKPGMFARAGLAAAGQPQAVGVRRDAVQSVNGTDAVFRPEGAARFRLQQVTLGPARAGGWIEIRQGLVTGDTVVVGGAFVLKAQLLRATMGEDGP
ncbi:MAG: efflux RND transporter periplasmic adaptor subunit, partial [Gemmatimonadota bacterium]